MKLKCDKNKEKKYVNKSKKDSLNNDIQELLTIN